MPSTPASRSSSTAARASSSYSGIAGSPKPSTRSRTPLTRLRGTSGSLWWWVATCSRSEYG